MGLFDNLFLDANTPVTINDGIDHSKDVVQPLVDPVISPELPVAPIDSAAPTEVPPVTDAGLVDLFESDKKDEKTSIEILHPEPPKDIALEIGLGVPDTLLEDTPDIDIGGDISFDIGGDMSSGSTFVDSSATESGAPPSLGEVKIDSTSEIAASPIGEVSGLNTQIAPSENPTDSPSDTALFSLLNNDPSLGENPPPVENLPIAPLGDSGSTPAQSGDIVFSPLFDMTPDLPTTATSLAPTPPSPLPESEIISSKETSPLPSLMRDTSAPVQSALTSLTTSPKLKAKISQFLGELESMEFGDQSEKEHKKQQIEMIRLRISEIRAESEMRIHALQLEMQTLEREIQDMDSEKDRIKNVIETFQKELDTV